jgi:hypothetical protein
MARARLRRIAQLTLKSAIAIVLGLVALFVLVLASLNLPPVRAFVAGQANSALEPMFRGRLTLRQIGHIDLRGVAGVDLEVADPAGNTVIAAKGLGVSLKWPELVYSAVVKKADPLIVHVERVWARELRVKLIDDGSGSPTLAGAFEPQKTEPEKEPGAETRVRVDAIEIEGTTVHGSLKDTGPLDVGLAKLRASFGLDAKSLRSTLDGVELRVRSPAVAALNPAMLRAKVAGAFEDLRLEAELRQEPAKVSARGRLRSAGKESRIEAALDAVGIDLSRLLPEGPKTFVAAHAELDLVTNERGGDGTYRAVLAKDSRFQGEVLPETSVRGTLAMPSGEPVFTAGSADIAEPGAATRVEYQVRAETPGVRVRATSRTLLEESPRVTSLTGGLTTSGVVEASAEYDGGAGTLNAGLSAKLRDVRHPSLRASRLDATASASGNMSSPKLTATLSTRGLVALDRAFPNARVTAEGTPDRVAVNARLIGGVPELIEVRATLAPKAAELVQAPRLILANEAVRAEIQAKSVQLSGGVVAVDGLVVDGVGRAEASLRYGRGLERARLRTERLRPASVMRLFGVQSELRDGLLDLEASYDGQARSPRVEVRGAATEVAFGRLRDGTARIDLKLENRKLNGDVEVALGEGANARIHAEDLVVPQALTAQALSRVNGSLTLDGDLELGRLQPMFPMGGIERADGRLRFDVALERAGGTPEPTLRASIESSSLLLVGQRESADQQADSREAGDAAPWTLRGIDVDVTAELADRAAKIAGRLHGKDGDLIEIDAEWKGISLSRDLMRAEQALMQAPFTARFTSRRARSSACRRRSGRRPFGARSRSTWTRAAPWPAPR